MYYMDASCAMNFAIMSEEHLLLMSMYYHPYRFYSQMKYSPTLTGFFPE